MFYLQYSRSLNQSTLLPFLIPSGNCTCGGEKMTDKTKTSLLPKGYKSFLHAIKQRIHESRIRSYHAVNKELIDLYWNIGREIAEIQEREGWGKSVVERLSHDLSEEFSGTTGFSSPNLWFMRQMYLEYREFPNLLQLVREIPWGQNIAIMRKAKDVHEREYYLRMTAEMGWSRVDKLPKPEELEKQIMQELEGVSD